MASPVREMKLVKDRAVERRRRRNHGRVFLPHEEQIAAPGAVAGGNVLGKIGAARNRFGTGGSVDAVSASAQYSNVAGRDEGNGSGHHPSWHGRARRMD